MGALMTPPTRTATTRRRAHRRRQQARFAAGRGRATVETVGGDWRAYVDTVTHSDLFDLCVKLPDASIDMILCDLPYGTTACSWDTVIPFAPMWAAFKRVIKPRGAIVLTASQPFTSALVMSNPAMFKYAMVWHKSRVSDHIRAKLKPLNNHEDILVFSLGTVANGSDNLMSYYPQGTKAVEVRHYRPDIAKGGVIGQRPSWVNEWTRTVEDYPRSVVYFENPNNGGLHPTQKPVALFEYLIRTYTREGDIVLDPTCGSGTTAVAAQRAGRRFICGDSDAGYVRIARKRLRDSDPYQPTEVAEGVVQHSLFAA